MVSRRQLIKQSGMVAGAAALAATPLSRSTTRAQETVKLQVWKAPHTDDDQQYFDGVLATFTEQNPNIEAEYRVTPWESWQETYTAAYAGDSPPDISYVVDSFFPKYSDAGSLVDLSKLEGADLSKWEPLYDPSIWARGTRKGGVFVLLTVDSCFL